MPSAGQILHHTTFKFLDGQTGNKYVIALNDCDNHELCLCIKTTSNNLHYPRTLPGCNSNKCVFLIFQECEQDLPIDTYVQLDHVYEIDFAEDLQNRQVTVKGHLSKECFNNLKKCLRYFRDDIQQNHWRIIYHPK
jgi:hypothetical protein